MSLLPLGNITDLNNDDIVNFQDFACIAYVYKEEKLLMSEDLSRDNTVSSTDILIFVDNWLWEQ